ncbi:MAG: hypothetical protein WCI04_03465 [archaeon]
MDKRATVIESIQKLLALGVSDSEIADNLYDVGINQNDAFAMIHDAKGGAVSALNSSEENDSKAEKVFKSITNFDAQLSMSDEIANQIPVSAHVQMDQNGLKVKESKSIASPLKQNQVDENKDLLEALPEDETDIAEIEDNSVEKIDVGEISPPKDSVSVSGFGEKSFPELKSYQPAYLEPKIPSTLVSQKNFAKPSSSQVKPLPEINYDANFEELWKKGIVVAVNAKLAEMKHLKDDVDSEISKKVEESLRKELYQFKVLMDSQKDLIVSSNKEALMQKQREISFIIDAKIAELRQYNKQLGEVMAAIDASKKQQSNALAEIATALEDAKRTKSQLVIEMNSELIKSKSGAQAFLDSASAHLSQMDERINKALELEKNIAEGMLAQAEQRIEELTISRADELISQLQVELNKLQTSSMKFSPAAIEEKVVVLDGFKAQFLSSMEDALNQINGAIEELNGKSAAADRMLEEKTLAIDAKLEELTKFEKDFSARLGALLVNPQAKP